MPLLSIGSFVLLVEFFPRQLRLSHLEMVFLEPIRIFSHSSPLTLEGKIQLSTHFPGSILWPALPASPKRPIAFEGQFLDHLFSTLQEFVVSGLLYRFSARRFFPSRLSKVGFSSSSPMSIIP